MDKAQLDDHSRSQMRKILNLKERNYIRLKRQRLKESMFEKLQVIGKGAFGTVELVKKV